MAAKLEGTFHLDGLIEGPVFSLDDEEMIRNFLRESKKDGITFQLSIDGGRFSILPDTKPTSLPSSAISADSVLCKNLEKWLKYYPAEECSRLMSTLRSVEYLPGREKQTVYGICPNGTVAVDQRSVETETIAPAPLPDRKEILKWVAYLLSILLVLIAISSFFVPYRDIFGKLWQNIRPFKASQLEIDVSAYSDYFKIEKVEYDKTKQRIKLTCLKSENYPQTEEQLNERWQIEGLTLRDNMNLQSIAKGYLLFEYFDGDKKFIVHKTCRIERDAARDESFFVLLPYVKHVARVEIR